LAEAIKRYRTAADRGHTDAQCKLGILYRGGEGVEKDPVEAVKWFRKAADKGDAPAQRNLAQMYERGEGVAKDPAEALRWRHKASESGDANDLNNLAWLLATSPHPEERNGREAVDYAEKAVAATSRTNAAYLDTLAAAYAETGDFAKAVTIQKEALALCNDESLKKELIFHLKLYESKKPCREP
jgi:TPR repeat protein